MVEELVDVFPVAPKRPGGCRNVPTEHALHDINVTTITCQRDRSEQLLRDISSHPNHSTLLAFTSRQKLQFPVRSVMIDFVFVFFDFVFVFFLQVFLGETKLAAGLALSNPHQVSTVLEQDLHHTEVAIHASQMQRSEARVVPVVDSRALFDYQLDHIHVPARTCEV
jgi:hypothetical protein